MEALQATRVLLQVGLDVGAIGFGSLSAAVSARRIKPGKSSYLQIQNKTRRQFGAGRYKISHLQQYLFVACNGRLTI
jgi:hypothetical protein